MQIFSSEEFLIAAIIAVLIFVCAISVAATLIMGTRFNLLFRRLSLRLSESQRLELNQAIHPEKKEMNQYTQLPVTQLLQVEVKLLPATVYLKEQWQKLGLVEAAENCRIFHRLQKVSFNLALVTIVGLTSFLLGLLLRVPE